MPPKRDQGGHAESKIVTELAKEFNIDEVYSGESCFIGSLKTVNEFNPVEVPSNGPVSFDETMIEVGKFSRDSICLLMIPSGLILVYVSQKTKDESKTQTEEEPEHDSDDESMGGDKEDEAGKSKEKSETGRQNVKLYSAESMLNTKKQKAEKKRAKKAKKAAAGEDLMDGDYDFKVDYKKNQDSAMDEGDEEGHIEANVPLGNNAFSILPEE